MTTAFETATNAIFADVNLAESASFMPRSGGLAWVRVIKRAPDAYQKVGTSMIETPSLTLEVKVSDCPTIVPGDQFQIGSTIYTVQGEPLKDELNLAWTVDLYAA